MADRKHDMNECQCTDLVHGGKLWICDTSLCKIQNNCKYGYVLPDRCRYTRHLGCDCGAYPPIGLGRISYLDNTRGVKRD